MTLPLISVIIVSYNTRAMTLQCIETLLAGGDRLALEIWVVDNGSTDGSAEAVSVQYPDANVIRNTGNRGFGAASNQAMRESHGEFLLLINSDAFVRPGAVDCLASYLRDHPEAAVVGPRLLNSDGTLQRSCFPFPTPLRAWLENLWISTLFPRHPVLGDYRRWAHDTERKVDHVIGACMMVRRRAYEETGGFDESFFMYSEETDWEKRMRDSGWEILFTPAAEVVHLGGASGANERARIDRHFFSSLDRYERKHHGIAGLVSLRIAMTIGCLMRAVLWGCVFVLAPRRRAAAASKARLHSWLVLRQTTHWRAEAAPRSL